MSEQEKSHTSPDNTYFIIEIVNPMNRRGFAIESPEGIKFCVGGYDTNTRQFSSKEEALLFSKKHDLKKLGRIHILSNHDIMQQYGQKLQGNMFVIVNGRGAYLFYDTKEDGYYFQHRFAGCCCWFDEKQAQVFADAYQSEFHFDKLMVHPVK